MSKVVRIDHVGLSVPDLEQAIGFYCDEFGFAELQRHEWANDTTEDAMIGVERTAGKLAMLQLGDMCMELFEYASPQPEVSGELRACVGYGTTHIAFEVTDLKSIYQKLLQQGLRFHCEPVDVGGAGLCTYMRDPFGNVIKLLEIYDDRN